MSAARALASSPSSGEFEVLRALRYAHAYDGGTATAAQVKRHFPKRITVAAVTAVLDTFTGVNITADSGNYALSAAGKLRSRQNPPRKYILVT